MRAATLCMLLLELLVLIYLQTVCEPVARLGISLREVEHNGHISGSPLIG